MAAQGPAVLGLAGDAVFLGHLLGRLAHRFAGGGLGDRRRHGDQVARPDLREHPHTLQGRLGLACLDQDVGEAARGQDRNVREALDAPRQDHVRVAQHDLVVSGGDGLVGGGAGAVEGVGGDLLRELRQQADLAADVGDEGRRDDLAPDHLVHLRAVEIRAVHELACGEPREIDGARLLQHAARPAERRATSGHDRHATSVSTRHYILPSRPVES